ncbi:MAG TPA: hypothetical protein VGP54_07020, partial [Gaiellaceae bacterium]|nr:hypothetical protein [Gaiellaceae bacterium]
MRALLATAGVLALAASAAAAGQPTAHTLRKSPGGPIEAIAQDGSSVAWLSSSNKACNAIHVLSPGTPDRSLPQPSSSSTTCHWNLGDGQQQLAFASRISTALWTLHESGPAPFDYVLAAPVGGPERQLERLAHASNGTGDWLVGVAGAGKTLAYSWDDVEYVNPAGCISGGKCKQRIADGGIRIVTETSDTALPGVEPALQLAAAAGRIAFVPATIVHGHRPSATTNESLPIVDAVTGNVLGQPKVHGIPIAIALSSHVLAVLTTLAGPHDRISWFSATDGTKLGSVLVAATAAPQLAASDQLIVYRVGRLL